MNTFGAGARPALCVNECGEYRWSNGAPWLPPAEHKLLKLLSVECCKYVCVFVRNYPRCAVNVSVAPAYIGPGSHDQMLHVLYSVTTVTRQLGLGYSSQFGDKSNCNFLRPQNYAVQYLILVLEQQEDLASVTRNSNDDLY